LQGSIGGVVWAKVGHAFYVVEPALLNLCYVACLSFWFSMSSSNLAYSVGWLPCGKTAFLLLLYH